MTAKIIQFPRRDRGAIRVERGEGGWLTIYDEQAWLHSSREAALQEANELATQINVTIIVQAPGQEASRC
jgi:hypothetical protein